MRRFVNAVVIIRDWRRDLVIPYPATRVFLFCSRYGHRFVLLYGVRTIIIIRPFNSCYYCNAFKVTMIFCLCVCVCIIIIRRTSATLAAGATGGRTSRRKRPSRSNNEHNAKLFKRIYYVNLYSFVVYISTRLCSY